MLMAELFVNCKKQDRCEGDKEARGILEVEQGEWGEPWEPRGPLSLPLRGQGDLLETHCGPAILL